MIVTCNSCGTNIEIEDTTRFVTCKNCSKSLEVTRTSSSVLTKVIEQQKKTATAKTINTFEVSIQEQIELLDNEWKNTLPNYMVQGQLPSADGDIITALLFIGIILCFVATILGVLWAELPFIIAGLGFAGLNIWKLINHLNRSQEFNKKKTEYEKKRSLLMAKIK